MAVADRPEPSNPDRNRAIQREYANVVLYRIHRLQDLGQLTKQLRHSLIVEFGFDPGISDQELHRLAIS